MIDNQQLRQALGQFATGVTIVTTNTPQGEPVGVTVSSFNSVSLEPPLVLWSIAKSAYSCEAFEAASHFAVHVLGAEQQPLSDRFARSSSDKFAGIELQQGINRLPLLTDCAARFQCAVEYCYEGGDHLIFVGRVMKLDLAEQPADPLLFYRSRYARLAVPQPC
ncbi:flavin reductase family protein [Oceanobacter mangrovi]|uniref:flavin reductase family protein n=1 Tax=Oceanobacter mangrovi TaxID=2862510 RepID=UPI001C8DB6F9|nr:flavin reductase family protein [Oceanobacter mangrovi]